MQQGHAAVLNENVVFSMTRVSDDGAESNIANSGASHSGEAASASSGSGSIAGCGGDIPDNIKHSCPDASTGVGAAVTEILAASLSAPDLELSSNVSLGACPATKSVDDSCGVTRASAADEPGAFGTTEPSARLVSPA